VGYIFYRLNRHHFSDVPLSRWIQIILLGLAGFAAVGWLPGGWPLAILFLALFLLFVGGSIYWRRRGYITFEEKPQPAIAPRPLKPEAKLPIFASGYFSVEGKHANFTWLQGYFRTFPTREHAVLCLVQPSRFALLGKWPEKEVGMWYIFFKDEDIEEIRWGEIQFGSQRFPGVAVSHRIFIPKQGRFDRDKTLHRTAYITAAEEEDARRILADLLYDQQKKAGDTLAQNGSGGLPHNITAWRRVEG
jgi:hypothetical protein